MVGWRLTQLFAAGIEWTRQEVLKSLTANDYQVLRDGEVKPEHEAIFQRHERHQSAPTSGRRRQPCPEWSQARKERAALYIHQLLDMRSITNTNWSWYFLISSSSASLSLTTSVIAAEGGPTSASEEEFDSDTREYTSMYASLDCIRFLSRVSQILVINLLRNTHGVSSPFFLIPKGVLMFVTVSSLNDTHVEFLESQNV
jgi:hypothetical protein